jgi:hypothetical protein
MGRRGFGGFIRVFPPELHIVVLVVQHGVGSGACTPTVAAYTRMPVETGPWFDEYPYVLFLAAVPGVLMEGGFVDSKPDVL